MLSNTVHHHSLACQMFHTIQYYFAREKEPNAPLPEGPSVRSVRGEGSWDILWADNPFLLIHFHPELLPADEKWETVSQKARLYNVQTTLSLRGH